MKKALAVIAMLAMVASAQADLLATWTIASSAQSVVNEDPNIVFGDLTANGLGGSLNGASYRLNNWAHGGASLGNSLDIEFLLEDGYTFTLDSIAGKMSVGGNPSPVNFVWQNEKGVDITDVVSFTKTGSANAEWTANSSAVWSGDGTLKLVAADGKNSAGANASSSSRTDMQSGLKVYGTVAPSSVPEPATMSLLGLGALALALRRKLRK